MLTQCKAPSGNPFITRDQDPPTEAKLLTDAARDRKVEDAIAASDVIIADLSSLFTTINKEAPWRHQGAFPCWAHGHGWVLTLRMVIVDRTDGIFFQSWSHSKSFQ